MGQAEELLFEASTERVRVGAGLGRRRHCSAGGVRGSRATPGGSVLLAKASILYQQQQPTKGEGGIINNNNNKNNMLQTTIQHTHHMAGSRAPRLRPALSSKAAREGDDSALAEELAPPR